MELKPTLLAGVPRVFEKIHEGKKVFACGLCELAHEGKKIY